MNVDDWIEYHTILETHIGSRVYGTALEDSDEDIRGICVPPKSYILGLDNFKVKKYSDVDKQIMSIFHWASLALQGGPNVLEILFVPEDALIKTTTEGEILIANRYMFLGQHVIPRYLGFAEGQRTRMTKLNENANSNEKRRKLIEEFGFDCKNAYHLVRLMRTGLEILTEGTIIVERPDADELLAIRRGEWSYEEVLEEEHRLYVLIQEARKTTMLPEKPNYEAVNDLIISIVETMI